MCISDSSADVCSSDLPRPCHEQCFWFWWQQLRACAESMRTVRLHLDAVAFRGAGVESWDALSLEEGRVGKGGDSHCSARWWPDHYKKNTKNVIRITSQRRNTV